MKLIILALTATLLSGAIHAQNSLPGITGAGGDAYNHAIVSVGYLANPLSETSQVGVYSAVTCNWHATYHCAGYESAIGLGSGLTVSTMNSYNTSNVNVGAGATIVRYRNYAFGEDTPGTHNAVFAAGDDQAFEGNWFIKYRGSRPSQIMGDIGIGMAPPAVANARQVVVNGNSASFVRLFVGGVEKGRISASANGLYLDALAPNGYGILIGANGSITIPSLAGSGSRAVTVDAAGVLRAQ